MLMRAGLLVRSHAIAWWSAKSSDRLQLSAGSRHCGVQWPAPSSRPAVARRAAMWLCHTGPPWDACAASCRYSGGMSSLQKGREQTGEVSRKQKASGKLQEPRSGDMARGMRRAQASARLPSSLGFGQETRSSAFGHMPLKLTYQWQYGRRAFLQTAVTAAGQRHCRRRLPGVAPEIPGRERAQVGPGCGAQRAAAAGAPQCCGERQEPLCLLLERSVR
jgi:hypothetical protein